MESGINQNGKWHIPKWKVAYTRMESGICRNGKLHIPEWHIPSYMWNLSIFSLYDRYCMIDIDAGPCSRGRAQTQVFLAKCLDESFAFQCVPQGWASWMVDWTLLWAHHTSHTSSAPSHTRDHAGAAMFMRSTPGCGNLAGPSLEWVAFRSPRLIGFAESPDLKLPGALGRPKKPGSCQLKPEEEASSWRYMTCIYLSYTCHIWLLSKTCFTRDCAMSLASECICTYWFRLAEAISFLFFQ